MIKLFWNTHNQPQPNPDKLNNKNARDYLWGLYHKNNSDKWIYEVLNKIKFESIQNEKNLNNEDVLIIIDSNVEKKSELYIKLKLICSKIYLIHLGDESGGQDLSKIYDMFNFVWRTFCSNRYFENKNVNCLPLGYKSGTFLKKKTTDRKYKWTFIGTPHKSSRHDMLFQLSNIAPAFLHKTNKFNEKIIEVDKMSEILSSTEFVPCPNGFVHPETYRLYEALECGCIPIVENAYKYYDRLFPKNPFLKINKWMELKHVINEWKSDQIKKRRKECETWWLQYKIKLQNSMKNKIDS